MKIRIPTPKKPFSVQNKAAGTDLKRLRIREEIFDILKFKKSYFLGHLTNFLFQIQLTSNPISPRRAPQIAIPGMT